MNLINNKEFHKFSIFSLLILIIGIPINTIENFILLILFIPFIIYSKIKENINFKILILMTLIIILFKNLLPTLKIQEGHNLLILNNNTSEFYENNLPKEIFNFVKKKYNAYYNFSTCDKKSYCWKNYSIKEKKIRIKLRK